MKYLVLYIILILILYMMLKISCYKDQKNILYNEKDIDLNLQRSVSLPVEKFDVRAIPSLDITSKEVIEKKSKFINRNLANKDFKLTENFILFN